MKILITLFLIFLLSFSSFSQQGWFWQNPLPQGNSLNSIQFFNDNTGWVAGGSYFNNNYVGVILKTTNGGLTWIKQNE